MEQKKSEVFSSRWGMLLAMMGMAVGTGNIWRFPRIAATNGGGPFLVAWVVFLLLWAVPLILLEFGMGKGTRVGPVGAFIKTIGPRFGWMGAWVVWATTAILFYYSVVMGWTIRYFWASLMREVPEEVPGAFWESFAATPPAVLTHAIAIVLGVVVVLRGVRGIETAAKILIPSLFVLIIVVTIRAVTLPGASLGLEFLFAPSFSELTNYRIWLEALTQNAWSTGAGWGLIMAYAIYLKESEDTALNAFVIGFGDSAVSLLAGVMVLCTVFSIMPDAASQIVGAGNEGITFIWVPQLFAQIPFGQFFLVIFFLALVFAAWTSLIAMIELTSRVLTDAGMARKTAVITVGAATLVCGIPSALSMEVFYNQDAVWGIALMLSGGFFAFAVVKHGVTEWREKYINSAASDVRVGAWWDWAARLVMVEAAVLIGWWFIQAWGEVGFREAINPFREFNLGTVLLQWAIALTILIALNGWIVRKTIAGMEKAGTYEGEPPGPPPGP